MGLEGHQVIVALHTNTQNIHAHIVVNRVHPDTLKVIQPHNGFDIEAAHKIVALIEKTHTPPPAHQDDLSPKIGYLQRILDYAFGAQGDIWVPGQRLDQTEVEKFNKEAEIIDYYMKKPEQTASQQHSCNQGFRSR